MKCLLLFFLHQQTERPRVLSFMRHAVCKSGVYENKKRALSQKYVSLNVKTSREIIKNLLFPNPENMGQTPCEKQGLLTYCRMLFLMVFNADIQQLTTVKANASSLLFSSPKTSFFLSQGCCSSLMNNSRRYPINEQSYEHFYRLRSLFGHALESDTTQKTAEKKWGLFWKKRISKLPI